MSPPVIGSLFSGYGGLDIGVRSVIGGRTAWVADICAPPDKGGHKKGGHRSPCTILAHRFPDAPNLGDVSLVDWSAVEPVDVLTLGFPLPGRLDRGQACRHQARHPLRPLVAGRLRHQSASAQIGCDRECQRTPQRPSRLRCGTLRVVYGRRRRGPSASTWSRTRRPGRAQGMTQHGSAYQLPTLTPRMSDSASSPSGGLPTPRASRGASSTETLALIPTPRAQARATPYAREDYHHNLEEWAGHQEQGTLNLLPTTTAMDSAASGGSSPRFHTLSDAVVREEMGTKQNPRHS